MPAGSREASESVRRAQAPAVRDRGTLAVSIQVPNVSRSKQITAFSCLVPPVARVGIVLLHAFAVCIHHGHSGLRWNVALLSRLEREPPSGERCLCAPFPLGSVRKATSHNAAKVRIFDRGALRPGMWADVAVFNPDTVIDKRRSRTRISMPSASST